MWAQSKPTGSCVISLSVSFVACPIFSQLARYCIRVVKTNTRGVSHVYSPIPHLNLGEQEEALNPTRLETLT